MKELLFAITVSLLLGIILSPQAALGVFTGLVILSILRRAGLRHLPMVKSFAARHLLRPRGLILVAASSVFLTLWLSRRHEIGGRYSNMSPGSEPLAGPYWTYIKLEGDGFGTVWNSGYKQNNKGPVQFQWMDKGKDIEIIVPQNHYWPQGWITSPGTHLFHKEGASLIGVGKIEGGELKRYGLNFGMEAKSIKFSKDIFQF